MKDVDPIFEMYIFEATQIIEQTESIILDCENENIFSEDAINELFRNMHTLKGSSAMMQFMSIANTAHALEDLIHMIREDKQLVYNFFSLSNLVLQAVDYFKTEIEYIARHHKPADHNEAGELIIRKLQQYIVQLKEENIQYNAAACSQQVPVEIPKVTVYSLFIQFTDDCQMENIRAFQLVHHLQSYMLKYEHNPEILIEDENSSETIKQNGFRITFQSTYSHEELYTIINQTSYIQFIDLRIEDVWTEIQQDHEQRPNISEKDASEQKQSVQTYETESKASLNDRVTLQSVKSSVVSVNVQKLDRLMDLVGELVIAEAMLANSIKEMQTDNNELIHTSQLGKITSELQDTIMSIRMVPLSPVFHKMRRVTRDMCQKLGKEISIEIIGEETEIDKSVIDQISDPLMHIVRNAIDHGIEYEEARLAKGKPAAGKVTLEARNIGSDVLLIISDDGQGIDKERLLQKAFEAGLPVNQKLELSDREIYHLIFHPGLSTKDKITEFSGRGVGMDVVASNIESIGGTIYIDSQQDVGTSITIKIPLTLAIIDGMNIRVGSSHYTIPTTSIKESFRPSPSNLLKDPDGNEMVMVRGECYSIVRLSNFLGLQSQITDPTRGILLMVEHEEKSICLLVDELIGQQQVVIKPLPDYFKQFKRMNRLTGCTLLGNGSISIILNMGELISHH